MKETEPESMTDHLLIRMPGMLCPACVTSSLYKMNACRVCPTCGYYQILNSDGFPYRSVWPVGIKKQSPRLSSGA